MAKTINDLIEELQVLTEEDREKEVIVMENNYVCTKEGNGKVRIVAVID